MITKIKNEKLETQFFLIKNVDFKLFVISWWPIFIVKAFSILTI